MEDKKDKTDKTDYSQGKIYKIVCNKTGLIYIGSTCNTLEERLKGHEYDCKRYLDKKSNKFISSIYVIFNNNYNIELIENFPCSNKQELEEREYFHIDDNKCINSLRKCTGKYNYTERMNIRYDVIQTLVDKCGKDIIKVVFRYGIDEYKQNKKH
jgi:hypothetical protein